MEHRSYPVSVNRKGLFRATVEDHELEADTFATICGKIDRALAENRKRFNLDLAAVEIDGDKVGCVTILGVHAGNGTLRIKGRKAASRYHGGRATLYYPAGADELVKLAAVKREADKALHEARERWSISVPYVSQYELRSDDGAKVKDAERALAKAYAEGLAKVAK